MFIVYFTLWVIFNGKWTAEIGVFGVIFAAVLYAFSCRFMGYSVKTDLALVAAAGSGIRYLALLAVEILKANVAVIDLILHRSEEVEPQLVRFTTELQSENHRVVLADSITLTPGTITCELENGRYLVHCLDKSLAEGIERSSFVDTLMAMEDARAEKEARKAERRAQGKDAQQNDAPQDDIPQDDIPQDNIQQDDAPQGDAPIEDGWQADAPEDEAAQGEAARETKDEEDERDD